MGATRWRSEAPLAVLAAVMMIAGRSRSPTPSTPGRTDRAVPSTAAAALPGRFAGPVETSRRLAQSLVTVDLPGLSVAAAVDGEIVWAEGFGWTDLTRAAPVTPLTRFRLGALSKPLTAAAAGIL